MKVWELIEELKKYPAEMDVFSTASDSGGYDAVFTSEILVIPGNKHPLIQRSLRENAKATETYWGDYMMCLYVGGKDED